MRRLLAIDPGPTQSAWVLFDVEEKLPIGWAKEDNAQVLRRIINPVREGGAKFAFLDLFVIERIASYGKPVGEEVFTTVLWTGRFWQAWDGQIGCHTPAALLYRRQVKVHLCGTVSCKDAHVRQRLIDIYSNGRGKSVAVGVKKSPGPLYGFKADCWQALALAFTYTETNGKEG